MELLALVGENLMRVFLLARHTLEFSKIFTGGEFIFELLVLVFVVLELGADLLHHEAPLLLEQIVFLQARPHVSLVLLIVCCDLALPLLEDLDFEAAFSGPLLSQVLIKLFYRFVAQLFALANHLLVIVFLIGHEPFHCFDEGIL